MPKLLLAWQLLAQQLLARRRLAPRLTGWKRLNQYPEILPKAVMRNGDAESFLPEKPGEKSLHLLQRELLAPPIKNQVQPALKNQTAIGSTTKPVPDEKIGRKFRTERRQNS